MFRKKSKREQKPPPGRPPRPSGPANNNVAANGAQAMSVNTNAKPPLGSVRRPSTMSSRSPRPNREPFSDATSKYSSASPSNRSTASSGYRVQKGLGKPKKGQQQLQQQQQQQLQQHLPSKPPSNCNTSAARPGASNAYGRPQNNAPTSAWNRVALQNSHLPTIREAESAYSGMSGIISSFSGHNSDDAEEDATNYNTEYDIPPGSGAGRRQYNTEFEFDENTAYFTEYGTEYTGMMSEMGGPSGGWANAGGTKYTTTGASIRTGLSSITEDNETNYDTHYTAMTDATEDMSAYTDYTNMGDYSAYSTGATNYTMGTATAYSLAQRPTQSVDDYSNYTDASTAYDTAYTGTAYTELPDSRRYRETFDNDDREEIFDFDLKDLSKRFKRGVKSIFACETAGPLSPTYPQQQGAYPHPTSGAAMRPSHSVVSETSNQSGQSLGDCLR